MAAEDGFDLVVTPASAGWEHSSLRVLTLDAGQARTFLTGEDEVLVVPLAGSASVSVDSEEVRLRGRADVFSAPTDFAYVPHDAACTVRSASGGRFALAGARATRQLPFRLGRAEDVAVEVRGAGQASRMVRNFCTVDAFDATSIIACEVVTPGGNWSSYPAHKHDETNEHESELEEIYYFEFTDGPHGEPGFGLHRTSTSPRGEIEVLLEVHTGDVALVPFGWHGPCAAAPGFEMYYLNVMAGPGPNRDWLISDHPEQTWIRDSWKATDIDPRLEGRR